jgi:alkaline phosphatase D
MWTRQFCIRLASVSIAAVMLGLPIQNAAAQSERGTARLMQGPMLGPTTESSARIWIRGSGVFEYQIEYDTRDDFRTPTRTKPITATKDNDYTMVFDLGGLGANTTYYYRVIAEGEVSKYRRKSIPDSFTTADPSSTSFRFSFGSCARVQAAEDQPIWRVVEDLQPDLFFWVGDNIYGDSLDPDILAEEYRRQRDVASSRRFLASVPQLATWDDHDSGLNDHDRTNPVKHLALNVFKQYWPNPSFGTDDTPGVFFKHTHSGVDFFFLDCRYHRDPNKMPDSDQKTMLGEAQFAWLIEELEQSDALFKFVISGSGFNSAKGPTGDSWSAFLKERDRLFYEIADRNIDGVILLSGDTHCAELNRIESPHPDGYPLYELVSSPLAQEPTADRNPVGPQEARIRPFYNRAPNAAVLDVDLGAQPPTVTMNIFNEYGHSVWKPLTLTAEELVVTGR